MERLQLARDGEAIWKREHPVGRRKGRRRLGEKAREGVGKWDRQTGNRTPFLARGVEVFGRKLGREDNTGAARAEGLSDEDGRGSSQGEEGRRARGGLGAPRTEAAAEAAGAAGEGNGGSAGHLLGSLRRAPPGVSSRR